MLVVQASCMSVLWVCIGCAVSAIAADVSPGSGVSDKMVVQVQLVTPSQAFHVAYQDYLRGNYDLAITELQKFVKDFPESSLAGEAYFYIGECYEQQKNLKEAARALTILIQDYKESRQRPAALFKLGKIMEKVDQPHKAKANWSILINEYPGTPEAKLASRHLKRM